MKRQVVLILVLILVGVGLARAGEVTIGLVSFDQFIPASGSVAGINAFEVFNFTGPIFGPAVGPPYSADSLTFTSATLKVNFVGGTSQTISLGDIGPGELLDSSGNPPVVQQFPTTDNFVSATFTATLSPPAFMLSDGTTFTAKGTITADITASSGSTLVAGPDSAVINAEQTGAIPTPEPSSFLLMAVDLVGCFCLLVWKRRRLQA